MAGKANSKLFGLLIPLSTSICFQKGCGPRPGVPPDSSCPQRKLTHVSAHIAWSTYTNKIRLYGQLGACWKYLYFFTLRNTDILTTSPWEKLKLVERLSETSSANFMTISDLHSRIASSIGSGSPIPINWTSLLALIRTQTCIPNLCIYSLLLGLQDISRRLIEDKSGCKWTLRHRRDCTATRCTPGIHLHC